VQVKKVTNALFYSYTNSDMSCNNTRATPGRRMPARWTPHQRDDRTTNAGPTHDEYQRDECHTQTTNATSARRIPCHTAPARQTPAQLTTNTRTMAAASAHQTHTTNARSNAGPFFYRSRKNDRRVLCRSKIPNALFSILQLY